MVGFESSRVPVMIRLFYQDKQAEEGNSRCPPGMEVWRQKKEESTIAGRTAAKIWRVLSNPRQGWLLKGEGLFKGRTQAGIPFLALGFLF